MISIQYFQRIGQTIITDLLCIQKLYAISMHISAVLCDALSPPANAILIYGPDTAEPYDFGTVATHECIDGFDLVGDAMRTCVSDRSGTITGIWNNPAPVCSRKFAKA